MAFWYFFFENWARYIILLLWEFSCFTYHESIELICYYLVRKMSKRIIKPQLISSNITTELHAKLFKCLKNSDLLANIDSIMQEKSDILRLSDSSGITFY